MKAPAKGKRGRKPDPRQANLFQQRPPTLRERFDFYREHAMRAVRARTRTTYDNVLKPAEAELSDYPTTAEVSAWIGKRLKEGRWGASTAIFALKLGSAACRYAAGNLAPHLLCPDPFRDVTRPPVQATVPRACTPDAFEKVLDEACGHDLERAYLCFLYFHGLRRSEPLGLYRPHVQLCPACRGGDGEPCGEQFQVSQVEDGVCGKRVAGDVDMRAGTCTLVLQRQPGETERSPLKGSTSAATFQLHPRVLEYLRRAQLRPVRTERKRGRPADAYFQERYLFPWRQRELMYPYDRSGLLDRVRKVAPEYFPKTTRGRGGTLAHGFRHGLGALLEETATAQEAQIALRHFSLSTTNWYFQKRRGRKLSSVQPTLNAAWKAHEKSAAEARRGAGGAGIGRGNLRALPLARK